MILQTMESSTARVEGDTLQIECRIPSLYFNISLNNIDCSTYEFLRYSDDEQIVIQVSLDDLLGIHDLLGDFCFLVCGVVGMASEIMNAIRHEDFDPEVVSNLIVVYHRDDAISEAGPPYIHGDAPALFNFFREYLRDRSSTA